MGIPMRAYKAKPQVPDAWRPPITAAYDAAAIAPVAMVMPPPPPPPGLGTGAGFAPAGSRVPPMSAPASVFAQVNTPTHTPPGDDSEDDSTEESSVDDDPPPNKKAKQAAAEPKVVPPPPWRPQPPKAGIASQAKWATTKPKLAPPPPPTGHRGLYPAKQGLPNPPPSCSASSSSAVGMLPAKQGPPNKCNLPLPPAPLMSPPPAPKSPPGPRPPVSRAERKAKNALKPGRSSGRLGSWCAYQAKARRISGDATREFWRNNCQPATCEEGHSFVPNMPSGIDLGCVMESL